MSHALTALSTFLSVRRTRNWSREQLEAWQERKIEKWLRSCPSKVSAFQNMSLSNLSDLPIMDKSVLMENFSSYNKPGITKEEGWKAFEGSRMVGGYHVGASTGTSGNRGLFVISDKERYAWLGAMLGKALPDFWHHRSRVAVILPLHTRLYDAANGFGPLKLKFFDLTQGPEGWHDELKQFAPTHIIAPPKILAAIAHTMPAPIKVFSGAEVLDPLDAQRIGSWAPLGQIYMATEGIIGVSCEHGSVHLCEDIMHVECLPEKGGLVNPVITDFRRTTQAMARYKMNDLLEMGEECTCGSPHRVIKAIHGREDDCFVFGDVVITPDVMRNAIVDSSREITDFRLIQEGSKVIVTVDASLQVAIAALRDVFTRFGVSADIEGRVDKLSAPLDRKLRRVERR